MGSKGKPLKQSKSKQYIRVLYSIFVWGILHNRWNFQNHSVSV